MKKYFPLIAILSIVKLSIQWIGNQNYGFHRDELLHLSVSEHLDWGYLEFPPFIALVGKIEHFLFGYTLWGTRAFPTFAGVAILILCCCMAIQMEGKFKSVLLSGICILAFLPFYRNHTLFQPVAFDQLWWALGFYFLIRFINSADVKYLLFMGLVSGIGLMNKYTMVVWGLGVAIGLIFYERGSLFKSKWLYLAGGIAFLVTIPNLIWQIQHDFPLLLHLKALKEVQLDKAGPFEFGLTQLRFPFTLFISIVGLIAMFRDSQWEKYKSVGVASVVIFVVMWIAQSKSYYFFAAYPVLFAAGSVKIEKLTKNKPILYYILVFVMLVPSLLLIPLVTPVLPIDRYVRYFHREEVNGRVHLTSDYADMFGWEEQVALVDSVYQSLSKKERRNCELWAENYGEAGALKILGKKYGLPDPICRHGSFWLWGYGNKNADVWISLGNEQKAVEEVFEDVRLIKIITHKYAVEEENNIPVYVCRKPRIDISIWWRSYEKNVFY